MENPVTNLIQKALSVTAILLNLIAFILTAALLLGSTENTTAVFATAFFAFITGAVSLAWIGVSQIQNSRELKASIDAAHKLSQGIVVSGGPDNELMDSLRRISNYIDEKAALAERIARGDLTADISVQSDSDKFAIALREMVGQLRTTMLTEQSRGKLQESVVQLLNEVSEVAAGDLTVRAATGPEITGSIAEAFNLMTSNLRTLIRQVKNVTLQVGDSAVAINETTEQLARGSVAQASQITRTTSAIADMAEQIQDVSKNAETSARVAENSLANARLGTKASRENINAMNCVRKQVQETAKRIKHLGERSQEIGQIVGMIEDLSERTSLLALNASLQASGGEKTPSGFAFVAEEIERLAERSNKLTHQIAFLAQAINAETKEVVASMEETIHEVIVGSTLADKAGTSLVEIERVSAELADLLRSISESARFQAKTADDISGAMVGISEVTELVRLGSSRAAESVRTLVDLSGELRSSISRFKLPPDGTPAPNSLPATESFVH